MSEYQYYEWQTIDRPLSAVNGLSSHMDTVTSTQASMTYSWGDFKHDPEKVLLQYFDAFLYDSNFGSRRLIFRLPAALVDVDAIRAYCVEGWPQAQRRIGVIRPSCRFLNTKSRLHNIRD